MFTRFIQFCILCGLFLVGIAVHAQPPGASRSVGANPTQGGKTRGISELTRTEIDVNNAFRNSESATVSYYFDDHVEITLPNRTGNFSKMQAQYVMKEFVNNNPSTSYVHRHVNESSDKATRYTIGDYSTSKGVYEVKVTYKNKNGGYRISSIQVMQQ